MNRKILLKLSYNGSLYHGWQYQPNVHTIQGTIENAIDKLMIKHSRVKASSRTDAGVHAVEQYAQFRTDSTIACKEFFSGLNHYLPKDIRLVNIKEADSDFDVMKSSIKKTYRYYILQHQTNSPFVSEFSWQVPYNLNIENMQKGLDCFVGKHNFTSFQASDCTSIQPIKEIFFAKIYALKLNHLPPLNLPFFQISITGNSFLKHMVRNMVGALVDIGKGKIDSNEINRLLKINNRKEAPGTAPSHGLFLNKVYFKKDPFDF